MRTTNSKNLKPILRMLSLAKRKEMETTSPDADAEPSPVKKVKVEDGSNPFFYPSEEDLEHIPKEFVKRRFYYISENVPRNPRAYGVSRKNPPSNEDLLRYLSLSLLVSPLPPAHSFYKLTNYISKILITIICYQICTV